jgi:hypothetical protein
MLTPLFRATLALLLIASISLSSCKKSSSDTTNNGTSSGTVSSGDTTAPALGSSSCGAVINGALINPIAAGVAERVTVSVILPDLLIVTRTEGINAGTSQLIQLHGVSSDGASSFKLNSGATLVSQSTSSGAYLVIAGTDCQFSAPGGGIGVLGQIFTLGGISLSEILLSEGVVFPVNNTCGANLLQSCFNVFEPVEEISSSVITSFLWKPESERNGNLVVLVNPFNVTVRVTGAITETLVNTGPSNGRGTTARANRPGCAYGSNVKVEFFDSQDRRILINNGNDSITVPSGCSRVDTQF